MRTRVAWMTIIALAGALVGCSDDKKPPVRPVEGKSFLMDADALDLETIVGLIKENQVSGAKELEEAINSDNGLNNVDLDNDGQIDFVSVAEEREGDDTRLDFSAVPSSKGSMDDAVVVASVRVGASKTGSDEVAVEAGYPNYVRGHETNYYHYRTPRSSLSVGEALFLVWAFDRMRPRYYAPMIPTYYAPRQVYSSSVRQTRRTTYRSQTKVSPVKKSKPPTSYSVKGTAAKAQKVQKSAAKKTTPNTSKLSDRKGQAKSFTKESGTKKAATGFGAKPKATSTSTTSRTAPTSPTTTTNTTTSKPSRPSSGSRAGSWGSKPSSSGRSSGRSSGSSRSSSGSSRSTGSRRRR